MYHRVLVRQTMDETWKDSIYCMAGEEEWTVYENVWGVLAEDEADARRLVVDMQGRAMDRTAEVVDLDEGGTDYTDIPGVVWQGLRVGPSDKDDEDDDDDDEEGDDEEFDESEEFDPDDEDDDSLD